jgi:CheY-like chemotaxis protein
LITDIEMPGMDGFELTTQVRDNHTLNALPIIMLTSLNNEQSRQRGKEVGASAYIRVSSTRAS